MDAKRFHNSYLLSHLLGESLAEIMAAAIHAVDAEAAVGKSLERGNNSITVCGQRFELKDNSRLILVGAGKASAAMAQAAYSRLGERINAGFVITKDFHSHGFGKKIHRIEITEAAHPVPDERNIVAAQRLKNSVENLTADDLVLAVISGGGSVLTTLPVENITLTDLQILTNEFLRCGAKIEEINCLRKHLNLLSGGGLARAAYPARVVSLIISDVVGSPLDVIASGLTAPDTTSFANAWRVVELYELTEKLPLSIYSHLQKGLRGEAPETAKPNEKIWHYVSNFIIADNCTAAEGAIEKARTFGFDAKILTCSLEGEACEAGREMGKIACEFARKHLPKPLLLVAGGETTVTVRGDGAGGRNQELALGAVREIAGFENVLMATLATDGGDGASDAAGAVIDGKTLARASQFKLEPEDFLRRNDSFHFFEPLDALLKPGATLTNVNDLLFILVWG